MTLIRVLLVMWAVVTAGRAASEHYSIVGQVGGMTGTHTVGVATHIYLPVVLR